MTCRSWLQKFASTVALACALTFVHAASAQSPDDAELIVEEAAPAAEPIAESPAPALEAESDGDACWDVYDPRICSVFWADTPAGYFAPCSTVGSIVAMENYRFPGTINTVTQDLIRDQQALSFDDILRDIGGAVQTGSGREGTGTEGLAPDEFYLRGLEVTRFNFRKNGFLDPTYTPRDFANIERVDVLKGPASVLYSAMSPAGVVNVVTKKAQQAHFAWGGVTLGSEDLQRYQFDVNSTSEAGDVLVRVNGAYQDSASFRNFGYNERTFIAPTITKLLSDDTSITWEGEYHEDRRMVDSGLIAVNGNPQFFNEDLLFGAPTDFAEFRDIRSTLTLTHRLNECWEMNIGTTSLFYDAPSRQTIPQTGFTTTLTPQGFYAGAGGIGGNLNRSQFAATAAREQNHAVIANLAGEVDGSLFTHKLLVGAEADWVIVNANRFTQSIAGLDPALTFNPMTAAQPVPGVTPINPSFAIDIPGYYQNRYGVYLQDVVEVTDHLSLMGGVRWDTVHAEYDRDLLFGGFPIFNPPTSQENYEHLTPRAGFVYELCPCTVSLYGLYTQSFNAPGRNIFAQAPLRGETGEMWEAGVKTQLCDELLLTVGGFYIERDDVAVQINNFNAVFSGAQRSRGVEANLVGQWTERFSTVSNYTYNDVEQFGPPGIAAFNGRVRGVPFGNGNMWARYNFYRSECATLGLGLGYVYVGERRGDYATPLRLGAYDRWDLGVFGQYCRWDFTAYLENIFDERYEVGSINQYQVYPGAPLNFRLQAGVCF